MTSDYREGQLFVTKPSNTKRGNLFFQGRSGIVRQDHPRVRAADEEHVTIDWLNGELDLPYKEKTVDSGSGKFWGMPYERTGKAIVKWLVAIDTSQNWETLTEEYLPPNSEENNWFAKLGGHEMWNLKLFTDSGWALATDPWGETEHWLPPRWELQSGERKGQVVDQIYCFTRENGKYRFEVAMQQTTEP